MTDYAASAVEKLPKRMKAVCVQKFGDLDAMHYDDLPRAVPGEGQVLVRVRAAGVGPWDAWIRAGRSALPQPLPLVLGAELSGVVATTGPGVSQFAVGDSVFGATNPRFIGAYAEYAVAEASMIARKSERLSDVEAASLPIAVMTAWQMLFDYGGLSFDNGPQETPKRVLVQGAAGSVGAYAVQLAKWAGAEVIGVAFAKDLDYVRALGADQGIDAGLERFEEKAKNVDLVLDMVGGATLDRSFAVLKPGGTLVSIVAKPDQDKAVKYGVQGVFFLVSVTTQGLNRINDLLDRGLLTTQVGEVLPLPEARLAHEMLEGKPHKRGKIVLTI